METDNRSPLAVRLLLAAAALGIIGDICLEIRPWGVGVPIFAAVVLGACFWIRKLGGPSLAKSTAWVALGVIPIAALFAWRDSDGLRMLNGLLLFLMVGMVALRAAKGAIYATSLADLLVNGPFQWLAFIVEGTRLAAQDVKWGGIAERHGAGRFAAVGRGLLLAVVPVGLFVILLSNADAVFQRVITPNLSLDPLELMMHLSVWTSVAVLSAGFLRRLFLARSDKQKSPAFASPAIPTPVRFGITEVSTVLVALNMVVGLFVAIQFKYLFGGSSHVHATTGLSYADYARRGFFELLTVVALSVPILLAMNGLLKRNSPRDQRIFRYAAGLFIVQIFIVAASALDRMKLYVDFYSLSPLRLYAVAGMVYMIGVLGLFLGTTLRGRSDRFAFGSLASLAAVVVALNVMNPDAVIAQYNLQDRPGYTVDTQLLASLSADATPQLLKAVDRLHGDQREVILDALSNRYTRDRAWQTQTLAYHEGLKKWDSLFANYKPKPQPPARSEDLDSGA
jgi:hypothetical protein